LSLRAGISICLLSVNMLPVVMIIFKAAPGARLDFRAFLLQRAGSPRFARFLDDYGWRTVAPHAGDPGAAATAAAAAAAAGNRPDPQQPAAGQGAAPADSASSPAAAKPGSGVGREILFLYALSLLVLVNYSLLVGGLIPDRALLGLAASCSLVVVDAATLLFARMQWRLNQAAAAARASELQAAENFSPGALVLICAVNRVVLVAFGPYWFVGKCIPCALRSVMLHTQPRFCSWLTCAGVVAAAAVFMARRQQRGVPRVRRDSCAPHCGAAPQCRPRGKHDYSLLQL
jgi:hypothetical protein